jgi:uncharacterized protein
MGVRVITCLRHSLILLFITLGGSLAYTQDPIHRTTSAFADVGGAEGAEYNASQGFHNVTM